MNRQKINSYRENLDYYRAKAYENAVKLSKEINSGINEDTSIVIGDNVYRLITTKATKLSVDIIFTYANAKGKPCNLHLHPNQTFELDDNIIYTGKRPK